MGAEAGPDIVTDGLVLALDGANVRSFRGEPTTNEIVTVTWGGDGGNQASFTKGSVLITDESLKYNGYETYLWSPGTSRNCYLNGADLSSSRTSTVWTFSCYVKREDGAPINSLNVYLYYPSSDGSSAGTIEDVGNGWYRISRTRSGSSSYISLAGFTGFTTGYKYYLSGAQLEKKSYTTSVVSTNTTRGATVATGGGWADLSGNASHGELVNGPTFDSDNGGSLVFDGTNDYIQLPSTSHPTGNCSLEIVFKHSFTSFTGSKYLLYGASGTAFTVYFRGDWAGDKLYFLRRTIGSSYYGDSAWGYTTGIYQPVPANELMHLIFTHNNTTGQFNVYKNGVLTRTVDGTLDKATGLYTGYGGLNTTTQTHYIGGAPSSNLPMNLYNFKFYNRALSTEEVLQNYNATRNRFGV